MKKQLLIFCFILTSLTISAEPVEIEGIWYELITKAKVASVVSNPSKYAGDIIIPSKVTYNDIEYDVVSIEGRAFYTCHGLKSLVIPASITSIGYEAFWHCDNWNSLTIEGCITSSGVAAFSFCKIENLIIMDLTAWCNSTFWDEGNKVAYNPLPYCNHVFYRDKEIKDLVIPNDVLKISERAFEGIQSLNSVTIPNSVVSIGKYAFEDCKGLVTVTLSEGLKKIDADAFSGCKGLTSITIPNSVTEIVGAPFSYCSSLSSIIVEEGNPFYDSRNDCNAIIDAKEDNLIVGCKNTIIPNSATSIGICAFLGCIDLISVDIPNNIKKIGISAFQNCNKLNSVILGKNITQIDPAAFGECQELKDVYCYAEQVPRTDGSAFQNSYIEYATLHVPAASIDAYKTATTWNAFKTIIPLPQLIYKVDGEIYKEITPMIGEKIVPEPAPSKEGYTFSGWSMIPETMPAKDVTITGTFNINKYKLTYKVDDEVYKSYDVEYGATITPEEAPAKEGYTFSGWSMIPETMPAHDVTITGTFTFVDPVTITAKSYEIIYGEDLPTFEYTSEGATLEGTPAISCEATKTSPVGTYPIVITKGSVKNYNDTYVNGTLTIKKAQLIIIPKDYNIKQGDNLPAFDVTYEGFRNNETSAVLTKQPTITTTATSTNKAGVYEINASGAEAQNYDISYSKGKLTIEAVEITPITETEETSISEQITADTDLENAVIGNTYYNVKAANGDGYNATEQALVLNSTTTSEQMTAIQNAEVGDAAIRENYSGVIFEIPAGQGTVTVDTKTIGTHVLNVQIGNGEPNKITKSERGTADVSYDVSASAYVYLYASTSGGSETRLNRGGTANANSVLLYGYKVTIGGTGINAIRMEAENGKVFDLNGHHVKTPGKGVYIINGQKVVIK